MRWSTPLRSAARQGYRHGGREAEREALKYASADLQGDKDIVMEAVKQKGGRWVRLCRSEGDKDFMMEVVKQRGCASTPLRI